MRSTIVVSLLSLAAGGAYLMNSHREQAAASAAPVPVTAPSAVKTSQVSSHDWAKNSLNRVDEVKKQVAQQRQDNDQ